MVMNFFKYCEKNATFDMLKLILQLENRYPIPEMIYMKVHRRSMHIRSENKTTLFVLL